jgi:hypothetical protein
MKELRTREVLIRGLTLEMESGPSQRNGRMKLQLSFLRNEDVINY